MSGGRPSARLPSLGALSTVLPHEAALAEEIVPSVVELETEGLATIRLQALLRTPPAITNWLPAGEVIPRPNFPVRLDTPIEASLEALQLVLVTVPLMSVLPLCACQDRGEHSRQGLRTSHGLLLLALARWITLAAEGGAGAVLVQQRVEVPSRVHLALTVLSSGDAVRCPTGNAFPWFHIVLLHIHVWILEAHAPWSGQAQQSTVLPRFHSVETS
mmetsp:Transcript_33935/g.79357  ORF Transcript_33935/g.79357 Transcript_33935/m.79357 type:complete len:216 (-) Transcript_33935:220-867(-)